LKKQKVKKIEKVFSIAFWMAIPCNFILGAFCFLTFLSLFDKYLFNKEIWALFAFGLLGSISVIGGAELPRLRVFIHESKHAVLVLFFGSSLKGFHSGRDEGYVTYEVEENRRHYVPLITLAPYCLPLFSFPMLLLCLVFGSDYHESCTLLLGLTLGADLSFSYSEINPLQSDFRAVVGGFFMSSLYIGGVFFLWVSVCLLWVVGGGNAFFYAAAMGWKMAWKLAFLLRDIHPKSAHLTQKFLQFSF
jgi:hypothetical protein